MSNYKLVALDMDGTVLDQQQQISDNNRAAIMEATRAGVTVMFATGRGIQSVQPYIDQLELKAPIVTVNGGEVWKEPNVLLERKLLAVDEVRRLRELALQHDTWYWGYAVEGLYNRDKWADDIASCEWLKFGYYYENKPVLHRIREQIESWGTLEVSNSDPCNLEINPKGITKASGLQHICALLGIEMSEVVAMGDSMNDIAMIRAAGLGVAMGNAQEAVKQAADLVTVSHAEDGVAEVIRKYVLA